MLSHFTQPGRMFADEFRDRLKVIACLEKPNMTHSEELKEIISEKDLEKIQKLLKAADGDAQLIFWGPDDDIKTALEVIEERCQMAFAGVPNETRKSFENGTTIFERVLPGADRMYPDTDSKPIPLEDAYIKKLQQDLPQEVIDRYHQLKKWNVPEDTYAFIFKRNHFPVIEKIVKELKFDPKFIGTFYGHTLKFVEGHYKPVSVFSYEKIYDMFKYIRDQKLDQLIAKKILPEMYEHPKMDFDSILLSMNFKRTEPNEIIALVPFLKEKFKKVRRRKEKEVESNWIMGELRKKAIGNIAFKELAEKI
jgi:glutamyl-tRNA(Gln) amidotransferase subunit E